MEAQRIRNRHNKLKKKKVWRLRLTDSELIKLSQSTTSAALAKGINKTEQKTQKQTHKQPADSEHQRQAPRRGKGHLLSRATGDLANSVREMNLSTLLLPSCIRRPLNAPWPSKKELMLAVNSLKKNLSNTDVGKDVWYRTKKTQIIKEKINVKHLLNRHCKKWKGKPQTET